MEPTVKEVLEGTKKSLLERGWCQNRVQTPTGERCLLGHLSWWNGGLGSECYSEENIKHRYWLSGYDMGRDFLINNLKKGSRGDAMVLSNWNDAPGRTKEEVLELLDKAIALCETNKTGETP